MNNNERLFRLKQLKIENKDGPLFKSSNECMEWIDNVSPLLKYDEKHYDTFMANAQYVRITTLSADRLMSHLNPMIGVVNQAIIELENNIESTKQPIPNHTPDPTADNADKKHDWHNKPLGIIALGVIIVVLGAVTIWGINHYCSINLQNIK